METNHYLLIYPLIKMITLIRPLLFSFLQSDRVKSLIVEMLEKLAESTDNDIDDKAVEFVRNGLFPAK